MTMKLAFSSIFACLWLCIAAQSAVAQDKRVALIIGNSNYKSAARMENPANDAADVAAALRQLGFHVLEANDLDKAGMDRIVRSFAAALSGAKVGLFFYAGHGLQVSGQNYLVPIDALLENDTALDFEMVRLDLVHRVMERLVKTNVIILDACRDNPLARNLARSLGTRSTQIGHGLALVESGEGTLISFSTQPGNVALDGEGRNSPFASALLKHMGTPGDDLSTILINVRTDVMNATGRKQVPWEHSALTSRFYFSEPKADEEQVRELALWNSVKDSTDLAVVGSYLRRYPQGTFAVLARNLAIALEHQRSAESSVRAKEAERQAELEQAREEVRKAQQSVKAAEAAKKDQKTAALQHRGLVMTGPTTEFPFDGAWNIEFQGSAHCAIKSNSGTWMVSGGVLPDRGKGAAKISASGAVVYSLPAGSNQNVTVVYTIVFKSNQGSGTYAAQGGRCTGSVTLVRP